ncbi:unnamed protein product [Adineta steineri]|uniref:Uncharacterized protein n=1 Tax=Adineta steineri TaxID=433720 RepID=A0A819M945_9BILA|nr:unnamed protein product [Adineta steineri]CAF3975581.1 unnamed protein product [Adineta steineri]
MDKHGFLYVSDYTKNEVRRWKMGEYNNEGIVVAGGNGKANELNQLNHPTFIFVDEEQSVYVSDRDNHRVMKWRKDAKEGTIVAGGNGFGENLNQLCSPKGIIVDYLGDIYVVDCWNHRVMRWYEGKEEGEVVVGGNGEGNKPNQLDCPYVLSPKPPSSISSKLQADFDSLTIPSLTKTENTTCSSCLSSTNQGRLNHQQLKRIQLLHV